MSRTRTTIVLLLLAAGIWLTTMSLAQLLGARAWDSGRIGVSRTAWRALPIVNVVEPDVAHTSRGLTAFAQRRYRTSRNHFQAARDAAPTERRCAAVRNLVLALEASAQARNGATDSFAQEREYRRGLRELDLAPGCVARDAADAESALELREVRARIEARKRYVAPAGAGLDQQVTENPTIASDRQQLIVAQQRLKDLQREAQQSFSFGGMIGRNANAARVDDGDPRW